MQGLVGGIYTPMQNEKALRESEEFARNILEASPDCLKIIGADGLLEYINQNGSCLLEVDECSDIIGQPWENLWPESIRPEIRQSILEAKAGRLVKFIAEAVTAKGTRKCWDIAVSPLPSISGEPSKILAVSRDITNKKFAEAELIASEARFRAAVEAVDGVVWTNNAAGEMYGDQPGWSNLTGQALAEYQGLGWSHAVHPDDAQPTVDAWNAAVTSKGLFEFEHRIRCKDSEWRWFGVRAAPIFNAQNEIVEWVGVHRDISARKATEEHHIFLMNELAHRSNNQLAIVQAMAAQTALQAESLDQFQKVFAKRLRGIAISTNLLVSGDWSNVPLRDLVHRQLEPFGFEAGRLISAGPDVFLRSEAAEAIGLALHELATNSTKYGAWSVPDGIVTIQWALSKNESEIGQVELTWTEAGGPDVTPPTRTGFGHEVIEGMVAHTLGGTVELKFNVEGLSWTLTFPHTQ